MRATLPLAAAYEPPSAAVVVLAGILALLITTVGWPTLRHIIAMAHLGGYATAASFVGKVTGVELTRGRALLKYEHPGSWLAKFAVAWSGYTGPPAFGLLGSFLLVKGQVEAVLWVSLVLLFLLLLSVANWFGRIAVILTGVALWAVARYAPDGLRELFAVTWVWFLLIGGVVNTVDLRRIRRAMKADKKPDKKSDVVKLWQLAWIPPPIGVALFWLLSVAALVVGAGVMLGLVEMPSAPAAPAAPTATPT
ncbi:M50 family metallopeptidase [Phytohabitans sp. LJ34]|uniref:M50 family metallopeptidase n=1 Tax=Phytohabitans sp. LJ34 TaxID=3452217 RepID=UPI003F8BC9DD